MCFNDRNGSQLSQQRARKATTDEPNYGPPEMRLRRSAFDHIIGHNGHLRINSVNGVLMISGSDSRTFASAILAVAISWISLPGTAVAAELDASVQQQIRTATFEVVQLKPPEGDVTYERPLPMELMPYQQRTDLYRSVGTAFAVGPNRYVTAGHVIALGVGSQFGPPALRDGTGKVYPIDQVLEYSDHEDFAVFSLREPPKKAQYMKAGPKPQLNDAVFAVGNALGEGVVIRDGVYTSDSPEEQDGKWNWLRFTAAASPGNSGGPLVDRHGQLVGVVLRKSPSENLNYALSIAQVLGAKEGEGRVSSRTITRLPIMDKTETLQLDEHFPLPRGLPDFYKSWMDIVETANQRGSAQLLADNAAHVFPHGAGSERLLHAIERSPFPQRVHEAQNGNWVINGPKPQSVQLEHNGFVEFTGDMIRMHAPDDVDLGALYGDSKLEMDLILKGYALHRAIGTDSVRVTSLGKAKTDSAYTDAYGRVWQIRAWAIPYEDSMLTVISLPTPEGFAGVFVRIPTGFWDMAMQLHQLLLDYVFLTMEGSLTRWQSYLTQKVARPRIFDSLKLEIDGDRRVRFRSQRFELEITPQLLKISNSSVVRLNFAFYHDRDAVVWDVAGLYALEEPHRQNWILVWRRTAPPTDLPDGFQSEWRKLAAREFPYNATISNENGETQISTTASAAATDTAKVLYALRVAEEGAQPQEPMKSQLDVLQHSFKQLER
jgi:serine protease Do